MNIGIVGHGSDKFTKKGELQARIFIQELLKVHQKMNGPITMVSGHSPVGGIDIWAEQEAMKLDIPLDLKIPQVNQWDPPGAYGFKARNIDIAKSEIVYVILADFYPDEYQGREFSYCYHCHSSKHIKSGGCWTGRKAISLGNAAFWRIVNNY